MNRTDTTDHTDTVDLKQHPIIRTNPGYVKEYELAKAYIWQLNHLGIKFDALKKMKVLGYVGKRIRQKDRNAQKRWNLGQKDPDPFDEAAVHCAAVNEYLKKCHGQINTCLLAENAWDKQRHASENVLDISAEPSRKKHLAEAKGVFKSAKRNFLDSLNPKKSQELAELVQQLK